MNTLCCGIAGTVKGNRCPGFTRGPRSVQQMRVASRSVLFLTVFSFIALIAQSPAAAQGWANGDSYGRAITIDHTKVPNTDQVNFPVLVSGTYSDLATATNGGSVTSANGYDIIFTSDANGTNKLAFEQQNYNP